MPFDLAMKIEMAINQCYENRKCWQTIHNGDPAIKIAADISELEVLRAVILASQSFDRIPDWNVPAEFNRINSPDGRFWILTA